MAYVSDESGTPEVYVRRYPQLTDVRRISVGGGAQPQWRRDQSELFYLAPDNALMADEPSFLFEGPLEMTQAPRISVVVNWTAGLVPAASRSVATTQWSDDTRMASAR